MNKFCYVLGHKIIPCDQDDNVSRCDRQGCDYTRKYKPEPPPMPACKPPLAHMIDGFTDLHRESKARVDLLDGILKTVIKQGVRVTNATNELDRLREIKQLRVVHLNELDKLIGKGSNDA